ncbi:tetratricopeptide repeat protein [Catellatospora sp. NPDC049111]|uniref:tetratricopeptide repeat protein n=1 Tax=Catellatospora sp. NPDC049111 TaxID=3155271 RepID=UPI0033F38699
MDAADLDYRARTHTDLIPPHLVSRLIELGHGKEVELQAGRGEWFCAREQARLLAGQDRQAEALEVLAPYVATGWWEAAKTRAGLLEECGRVDEAIELARPYAEAGDRLALGYFARLLARQGRGDEAFSLLSHHVEDWVLAEALVDVSWIAGRDEDAATLLAARTWVDTCHDSPPCRRHVEPPHAVGLLATIRERQGRVDEAIDLLHTRYITSVNNRDQLADLLARHDRIEELRSYAATEPHGHAARRLAELLEERGDAESAIAAYGQPGDSPMCEVNRAAQLAPLLVRHGRVEEATEVLRSLADSPGRADDCIVNMLCTHYTEQGRAEEGLAYLDTLKARRNREDWEFFRIRLTLLFACGLREEAMEQARAHPEGGSWYAAWSIANLMADAGRVEEAVALLEQHQNNARLRGVLAAHLIELGRVKDAIAVIQRHEPAPAEQLWTDAPTDLPPF